MIKPVRFKRYRTIKGWRIADANPKNGLPWRFVGRVTIFGNPFRNPFASKINDTQYLVDDFEEWLDGLPAKRHRELIEPLIGHNIACWCAVDQPCHGDVLLERAWNLGLQYAGQDDQTIE